MVIRPTQKKVGVTLQRKPYETEIDIFPQLNPLLETVPISSRESVMSELTSVQTEDRLCKVVKHQTSDVDLEEFRAIPLKRIGSGPHQHRIQDHLPTTDQPADVEVGHGSQHFDLMKEIDDSREIERGDKVKAPKKESTLSRLMKGIRKENSGTEEGDEKLGSSMSLGKIFQRMNPVGKTSRDGFSKVFHRIGDALQKKPDEEKSKTLAKETKLITSGNKANRNNTGDQKYSKIGEKMIRCKPTKSSTDLDQSA